MKLRKTIGNSLNLNEEKRVISMGFGSGKRLSEYTECLVFVRAAEQLRRGCT